jgi:hypothetical protein
MLTLSAAAASFFLFSFSAFFARPDSFFALAPFGGISESQLWRKWTAVGAAHGRLRFTCVEVLVKVDLIPSLHIHTHLCHG